MKPDEGWKVTFWYGDDKITGDLVSMPKPWNTGHLFIVHYYDQRMMNMEVTREVRTSDEFYITRKIDSGGMPISGICKLVITGRIIPHGRTLEIKPIEMPEFEEGKIRVKTSSESEGWPIEETVYYGCRWTIMGDINQAGTEK